MAKSTQNLWARLSRAAKRASAQETAAARKSRGQQQQAAAKQTAAARIRSGRQRQAAAKDRAKR
jgi:hypothetical protein